MMQLYLNFKKTITNEQLAMMKKKKQGEGNLNFTDVCAQL